MPGSGCGALTTPALPLNLFPICFIIPRFPQVGSTSALQFGSSQPGASTTRSPEPEVLPNSLGTTIAIALNPGRRPHGSSLTAIVPGTVGVVKYFLHESSDLVKDPNRVNALVTLEGKAKATGVLQMSVGVIALLTLSVVGAAGYTITRICSPGARIGWGCKL